MSSDETDSVEYDQEFGSVDDEVYAESINETRSVAVVEEESAVEDEAVVVLTY